MTPARLFVSAFALRAQCSRPSVNVSPFGLRRWHVRLFASLVACACSRPVPVGSVAAGDASPPWRAIAVAAGYEHSCALGSDGRVFCWGRNDHGQLGATATDICALPDLLHGQPSVNVPCRARPAHVVGLSNVTQIAIGANTTCARTSDGAVSCWGENTFGTIGDGTTTDRPSPTRVPGLSHVAQIAISSTHACALHDDGTVDCWGLNFRGQLGTVPVPPPPGAVDKLGIAAVKVPSPQRVPGWADVTAIATGDEISCAKNKAEDVSCFGMVAPQTIAVSAPAPVPALHGATRLVLNEGYPNPTHCALFASGGASCWGSQATAPMLPGSTMAKTPVTATAIANASFLALGQSHACVVSHGEVSCWGGDASVVSPRIMPVSRPAVAVAIGVNHACALLDDGAVACWGDAFYGQTGAFAKGQVAPTTAFYTAVNSVPM